MCHFLKVKRTFHSGFSLSLSAQNSPTLTSKPVIARALRPPGLPQTKVDSLCEAAASFAEGHGYMLNKIGLC